MSKYPLRLKDKVEIIGNIPFILNDKPRPIMGTVTGINGYYVMVRPKGCRWEVELLDNEVKLPGAPEFPDAKRVGRFTYIHPSLQINSFEDFERCDTENVAIYCSSMGSLVRPARVFAAMSFHIVQRLIREGAFHRIININPKK